MRTIRSQHPPKIRVEKSGHDKHGPPAVVVGLDSLQGLQSARVLADRGIHVIGVAKDAGHYASKTRACRDILVTDTGGADLVLALENLGKTLDTRAVLFPCQDKNVLIVSEHRDRLKEWYHIILPSHATVELLMNKEAFYRYGLETGLPIPTTYILCSEEEARQVADQISYPCILKPPFRLRQWSKYTKEKAFVSTNKGEFLRTYEQCRKWSDVLIAQRLIPGDDTNHYTCNCYFGPDGKPLVTFTSRKLRQWPPQTGQACLSEEVRNDVVVEETSRVFQELDYRGLGYLEMKRDAGTGEYLIIEPNVGRPTGRASLAEAAGVDLLYTMYCDAVGLELPPNRQQTYRGVKWIHLMRDLQAAIHHWRRGQLTARGWWRSVRGKKTFAVLSLRDPLPFLSALWTAFRRLFAKDRRFTEDL